MAVPSPQHRITLIYQMLFELAAGNHNFRIDISANDDIDQLANVLNTIAKKLQSVISRSSVNDSNYTSEKIVQMVIVLDTSFKIKGFNTNASKILDYPDDGLLGLEISDILFIDSVATWNKIKIDINTAKNDHITSQLIFQTNSNKIIPTFCTVSKLLHTDKLFISSITLKFHDSSTDKLPVTKIEQKDADAQLMLEVYNYIKNSLDAPLPSSKTIAKQFGINEFRLKDSFRYFFKTSIHQFYNEERLKKAHLLILQTNEPIKNIAFKCGFNTYLNFYKAFKKKYNYAPTSLKRLD